MLRGRAREREAIDALLDRASAGHGGGLVLHGEPGVGKSALLGYATERASGMRVLRTTGVEPESDLGYATLHRLLRPLLDATGQLPPPQARALDVVFGQGEGSAPDRFLVALATLSLLSDAAGDRPVLCVVDDAHWADSASLGTFTFVARRLDAEPIALLLAARADEGQQVEDTGLVDVPLAGLDGAAARELLADHGGDRLSAHERDELLRATGGNPLAIRELVVAGGTEPGGGEPLPLSTGLQRAFLRRARDQGDDVQRLLLVVAVDGSGRLDVVQRAARTLDPEGAEVGVDAAGGLLVVDGQDVTFRHPLIRSALYHAASDAERRAAHRALAAALTEPAAADRRAWHLGQAAEGPDEAVAGELHRSAERASRRAGPTAAAVALAKAADLSESEARRASRLVEAADAWWHGGHPARATALLDQVDRLTTGAATRIDVASLRALVALRAGNPTDALTLLTQVLPSLEDTDPHRAALMLAIFGEATFHTNAAAAWVEVTELVERLPLTGTDPDVVLTRLFRAACRVRTARPTGLEPGDLDTVAHLTQPTLLAWAGGMVWGLGDRELARQLHRSAERHARAAGAVGALAWVLDFLVTDDLLRARFAAAEAHAEEGRRFATETAQANVACRHQGSLALLAALQGRDAETRQLADELLTEASTRQLPSAAVTAYRALGLLELAAGRPAEAVEHLRAIFRDGAGTHPGISLVVVPDLVEAAVRAQRPELAAEPFERFRTWAHATSSPSLQALAARGDALLSPDNGAAGGLGHALDLYARTDDPLEQARTELLLGEQLRRERRRSDARPHLRAAMESFRRIGATSWADRAAAELRATGETARRREPSTLLTLTPQERRIAALVGEGATNRDVAAQLFLSPRTVDYHLRKVFQKLGITSRNELARMDLAV